MRVPRVRTERAHAQFVRMPMTRVPEDSRDVLAQAARWQAAGQQVALITVTDTWGSSPRPVGSMLAVTADGRFTGSVSGGCIEAAAMGEARALIGTGERKQIEYGVSDDVAWGIGLACGGRIKVAIEPLAETDAVRSALLHALDAGGPAVLVRELPSGDRFLVLPDEDGGPASPAIRDQALSLLQQNASRTVELDGRDLFFQVFAPPMRLIVVGAVRIGELLAQMAALAGYDVCFIEPRRAFASREPILSYAVHGDWPDEAVRRLAPDSRTALVALTHDPKLDDPALVEALRSPAFYIGCLGSRRTHAARCERLAALGVPPADLGRIHGPVGLAIGAKTQAEIAVSILADLVRVRRQA